MMKKINFRYFMGFGAAILILALAESFIFEFIPINSFLYRFRPERISYVPGSINRYVIPGVLNVRFKANNLGYHDYDRSVKKSRSRILFMGDSFVESAEIQNLEKTHFRRLDGMLNDTHRGCLGWEVIPMGMSGQGTAQYSILYEKYARKFKPDVVIVLTSFNDLDNNLEVAPRYRISEEGGFEIISGRHIKNSKSKIILLSVLRYFDIYHALRSIPEMYRKWKKKIQRAELLQKSRKKSKNKRRESSGPVDKLAYFEKILLRIKNNVEKDGGKFLHILQDSSANIRTSKSIGLIQSKIKSICESWSVECVSLAKRFSDWQARTGKKAYFEDRVAHWNGYGHQLVAEAMYEKLVNLGWVGSKACGKKSTNDASS